MALSEPQNPDFEAAVRESFARQRVMARIGARLISVSAGEVEIELPFHRDLTNQHGFVHAGIVTMIADNACGYAALSRMPPQAAVLTVEYKTNFLAPALGERLVACGRVHKAGRTITVCSGDVFAVADGKRSLVATMLATMMTILDRPNLVG